MVSKYRNIKTNGYHSKKEAGRAATLRLLERAGEISCLEEQPKFELIPKQDGERAVKYIADFQYMKNGCLVVEDVKSEITRKNPDYIIKRKLMLWVYNIRITET